MRKSLGLWVFWGHLLSSVCALGATSSHDFEITDEETLNTFLSGERVLHAELRSLRVTGLPRDRFETLVQAPQFSACTQLEVLDLGQGWRMTQTDVPPQKGKQLVEQYLSVTVLEGLVEILPVFKQLKHLNLSRNQLEGGMLKLGKALQGLENLESLDLSYNALTAHSFFSLCCLPKSLRSLNVGYNRLDKTFQNSFLMLMFHAFSCAPKALILEGQEDLSGKDLFAVQKDMALIRFLKRNVFSQQPLRGTGDVMGVSIYDVGEQIGDKSPRSQQYGLHFPKNAPVLHTYNPTGNTSEFKGVSTPITVLSVLFPQSFEAPTEIQSQLGISGETSYALIVQNNPWTEKASVLLRPHYWADPEAPYQRGGYNKAFNVHIKTALGMIESDKADWAKECLQSCGGSLGFSTHSGTGNMVISSPNNAVILKPKKEDRSYSFWSNCSIGTKKVVTLHWVLEEKLFDEMNRILAQKSHFNDLIFALKASSVFKEFVGLEKLNYFLAQNG